jgi:hypothetical protein
MDNKDFTDAKVETGRKIKTLLSLTKGVEVSNTITNVDPSLLFMRLVDSLKVLTIQQSILAKI